jgi:hypothetical protein
LATSFPSNSPKGGALCPPAAFLVEATTLAEA